MTNGAKKFDNSGMATAPAQQKTVKLREFIIDALHDERGDAIAMAMEEFGLSRQAINFHIKEMEKSGVIAASGNTRGRQYRLGTIAQKDGEAAISAAGGVGAGAEEHEIWRKFSPVLKDCFRARSVIGADVPEIWEYGASEMINNALEHSGGGRVRVCLRATAAAAEVVISDDGVGALKRISEAGGINNYDDAIMALATGKVTTAPDNHSGEGIFFTSRIFDEFDLSANGMCLRVRRDGDHTVWRAEKAKGEGGTAVRLLLRHSSGHSLPGLFGKFSGGENESENGGNNGDTDTAFRSTEIPVLLAADGGRAVSRSQARRLLVGAGKFRFVNLNFTGITFVGQGFADEVFRVFTGNHPNISVNHINASAEAEAMLKRARFHGDDKMDLLPRPTQAQARYYASEIMRRGGRAPEDFSRSLMDATIELTPHQIDAAVFALRNPAADGAILADEVGLGKTIEAGLALCQYWAENKRRLLVLCPAALRKQWALELEEKFDLPSRLLDGREWNKYIKKGEDPLSPQSGAVVVMSYNLASNKEKQLLAAQWDLAVLDEAHKLRGAYREPEKPGMAQKIKKSLSGRRKILLTATPLHNSLLDIFGLFSVVDENIFGDRLGFSRQYKHESGRGINNLRERMRPFLHRRLRRDVLGYVRYTNRRAMTCEFNPTKDEKELYDGVSGFLRECEYAVPKRQSALLLLLMRKMLSSSPLAIAGTLEKVAARVDKLIKDGDEDAHKKELEKIAQGDDDEISSDWNKEEMEEDGDAAEENKNPFDREKARAELNDLRRFIKMAKAITPENDSKLKALFGALENGFSEMQKLGAAKKALIFTESKRTQRYLAKHLAARGYGGKIAMFSAQANDPEVNRIYADWKRNNAARVTGSRETDIRMALVDFFRNDAEVMIATEAGGEGINLQFCSLVVNYDLPWNPQRIEQRIGRCHRYGQRHDVVVMNFLNKDNRADELVLSILTDKFRLFSDAFGASDEILGFAASGVDFEKRVLRIYQECRTAEEIGDAFARLQKEHETEIAAMMASTREKVINNLDSNVLDRLKMTMENARERMDKLTRMFWAVTRHEFEGHADFDDDALAFDLRKPPPGTGSPLGAEVAIGGGAPAGLLAQAGRYVLLTRQRQRDNSKKGGASPSDFYRPKHPLGEWALRSAAARDIPAARLTFRPKESAERHHVAEKLIGQSGWLVLESLGIKSRAQDEEFLLFSGVNDKGKSVPRETLEKLFLCPAAQSEAAPPPQGKAGRLDKEAAQLLGATVTKWSMRRDAQLEEEENRLERWADDKIREVQYKLDSNKQQTRRLKNDARTAETMEAKLKVQQQIKKKDRERRAIWRDIQAREDAIEEEREKLMEHMRAKMMEKREVRRLLTVRWVVE